MQLTPDWPGPRTQMESLMPRSGLRKAAAFLVVGICSAALAITVVGVTGTSLRTDAAGTRDYVAYWAAGQQLAHHANPYDRTAILGLERSAGYAHKYPALMMRNPPTALPLVLPLGYLGPRTGELLWSLFLFACLFASVRMVWTIQGRPKSKVHLLGYSFGPALLCIEAGQMGLVVLLGLTCFLRWHGSRPFLAGVSLWLCMLKPHLFVPFGTVLLAWVVVTRSYNILAGVALALGVSVAAALILDPLVWAHYGRMLRVDQVDRSTNPWLTIMLRRSIDPNARWLQYLPAALGCVWGLAYYRRHRAEWDWMAHGSLLTLVSLAVAPYAWITDQAILVPAVLNAAYVSRSQSVLGALALASAIIELGVLKGAQPFHSAFFVWTAPAWLAWYVWAIRFGGREGSLPSVVALPISSEETSL